MRFFIIFYSIYGLLHLYAFLKTKKALSFGGKESVPLVVFMVIMMFSPSIIYYLERSGIESLARLMSYAGYIWMGFLILFISACFFIDIYRLLIYAAGLIFRVSLPLITPAAGLSFYICVLFAFAASIYGFFEARDIRTEHLSIKTSKVPEEIGRIKIVQISDVHIGLIVREERLKRIINEVKKAEPDVLVSTGDLVDGQINRLEGLAEMLHEVKPKYGKFAITGNHEFYAGLKQALDFTKRSGFTILRGESSDAAGIINIAGVDDRTGRQFGLFKGVTERELLSGLDREKFTLLLKHRPRVDKDAQGLFDLQLSGHTHKGQLFPFSLITKIYFPKHSGYSKLLNNSHLYISRGTGTWGPPIRFLSPPEVTVVELVHETGS
jgi:predicted MPP superfamily phosphohydrolase